MLWCMSGSLTRSISSYFSQYLYLDSEVTFDMIFWNPCKMHHLHLNVSSWQHIEGCIWNQLIVILWRIYAQMNWGIIIGSGNALLPVRHQSIIGTNAKYWHFSGSQCLTFRSYLSSGYNYRRISNIRRTKSQNLNTSHLGLQLSLSNILKPGVKSRMKI